MIISNGEIKGGRREREKEREREREREREKESHMITCSSHSNMSAL